MVISPYSAILMIRKKQRPRVTGRAAWRSVTGGSGAWGVVLFCEEQREQDL